MKLSVKIVPGASDNRISGWLGERLKIRVTAPPENGKANTAVIKLLAKLLNIPAGNIQLMSGATSPKKTIEITGLSEAEVLTRISSK